MKTEMGATVMEATVGVRLDGKLLQKLDKIAEATQRTRSQVLRLLLSHAEIPRRPELVLVNPGLVVKREER